MTDTHGDKGELRPSTRPPVDVPGAQATDRRLRLLTTTVVSLLVLVGAFWVIVVRDGESSNAAAFALIGAVVAAWTVQIRRE